MFIFFLLSSTVIRFLHCIPIILSSEKKFCEIDQPIASYYDPSSDVMYSGCS